MVLAFVKDGVISGTLSLARGFHPWRKKRLLLGSSVPDSCSRRVLNEKISEFLAKGVMLLLNQQHLCCSGAAIGS